jgi:transposase InsO family protein
MPWKVSQVVEERMKFIVRLLEGEKMTDLCNEFGISRKTGYKIVDRYKQVGVVALDNQSRRPHRNANLMSPELSAIFLALKKDKPSWGAPKLRALYARKYPHSKPPAISTVHALLDRNGLVAHKRRPKSNEYKATGTYLSVPKYSNDLWCVDFKGQFKLGNQSLCYPLTISDFVSRKLFAVEGQEQIDWMSVKKVFQQVFLENGLPVALRSDNGPPFASKGLFGLTKLSVWWLKLGIKLERIKPGCPQQNGRHERMHRTLKLECTFPASQNILSQQERFDQFIEEYNRERPHESLEMKTPDQVHVKSERQYSLKEEAPNYSAGFNVQSVSECGGIKYQGSRVFISSALGGQLVGIRQVDELVHEVRFMGHKLGYFDTLCQKFTPAQDPFHWAKS